MNQKKIFSLVFLSVILFSLISSFVKSDVISLNSGGSENIAVTSNKYIEGFFSQIPSPVIPTSTNISSSSNPSAPVSGGGGGAASSLNITINPTEFNINLAVNTNIQKTISVTNLGASSINVNISQKNLDNFTILSKNFLKLASGETKTFNVIFVALDKPGIYTGKIIVGGKTILVSLNIRTELILFDSNIIVLNRNYKVAQGSKLQTQVTLIPMGDKQRMDVTLNYIIKDYNGTVYLTKSETLLVKNQMNFRRDFDTGMLPLGNYIVGLELVYSNGMAPSSAHFEVVKESSVLFSLIAYYLFIAILLTSILIIILLIIRFIRRKKLPQENYNPEEVSH